MKVRKGVFPSDEVFVFLGRRYFIHMPPFFEMTVYRKRNMLYKNYKMTGRDAMKKWSGE